MDLLLWNMDGAGFDSGLRSIGSASRQVSCWRA